MGATMQDDTPDLGPIPWRNLLHFDSKAIAAIAACALILVGLLGVLPAWLRGQERADFAGTAAQTAPGVVVVCQISPVSQGGGGLFNAVTVEFNNQGGGGLFNAVTVEFNKRQSYYALPPESKWLPKFHQKVRLTYRVGRQSGTVRVDSVTPE